MTNKIIEFIPSSEEVGLVVPAPKPAKNYIPDWYKTIPVANQLKNPSLDESGALDNATLKMCMPFSDSLTSGYIQETPYDIVIKRQEDGSPYYWYVTQPQIISCRTKVSTYISEEYYQAEFTWLAPWIIKTPPGWSCIITHPFNRQDLPFTTMTGIIDTDKFHHSPFGATPFNIKASFTGVIPAGTPMYQIIPFERSKWESQIKPFNEEVHRKKFHILKRKLSGVYMDNMWTKKHYK